MKRGDIVLIYHSNAEPPGVVGIASVRSEAKPDPSQFEVGGEYFDPAATTDKPRWFCPELAFLKKLPKMLSLEEMRNNRALDGLALLQKGSRLSVIPVSEKHFAIISHGAS
jgi:predicted RNA-binding protein with PUA-like domain